ncbi:cip1-interacting zinc finger protein isoform X1 [Heterocephalus glaber]|uniref:Cip1-interacting zinc finger protein isoform X1 n=1 Tax=Heterocephalus glaber TaxID=10181 RepID=A0AAX6TCG6_HETGA|nr:cip1-interacting zinc finger protein isoform X1 [Heterocephalus glaber]
MFSHQQQLQQQQQLLQLQQLLQQSPPQAPLPMAMSRSLPQQQPQQQLLNLQATSLLNGSMLQRALLLQQLQGLDQFAMPPATYDSAGLTMPTATLGNLRGYSMATPSLTTPSITPSQLGPPNLQQFFPQATRQSLLGPPPVGVPMNPSQLNLSGRNPQKQTRTHSSNTPNRKDSSSQTMPVEDGADPREGSEEAEEFRMDTPEDQDSLPCPDGIMSEKLTPTPEPEPCEVTEPLAKRLRSSERPTEKGPPGQSQVKVQPQARMTVAKQTQTPELLPEPPEARVLPRFQPRVLQIQAQVQPQTPPQMLPVDTQVPLKLQKQAQTQTSPEHLVPLQKEAEPQKQVQSQACAQPPKQGQLQLQKQAQTQTYPQVPSQGQLREQPQEQPPEQPSTQVPVQPPEQTQGHPETQVQGSVPTPERVPMSVHATVLGTPAHAIGEAGGGMKEASPEPVGAQVGVAASQESSAGGTHAAECEKRAREMLGVWGAGGSLKVTILQSSDSRAFNTAPLTPGPRPGDSSSATPVATSTPSKQGLHFFCYVCKVNCSSQQEFQDHMSEAQHLQRLSELQHMNQACLLSLLPMPRDALEREEEPPPRRWCNTCQVYYVGDLIQHRRTQDHKVAKQSLRPFCTICNRYFKTPRKFVEHVKSQGHKDKAKETLEKETAGQDEDHFITVDAVGCFEGDEEEEEEDDDEEEEVEVEEELCKQLKCKDGSGEERKGLETYSSSTVYGKTQAPSPPVGTVVPPPGDPPGPSRCIPASQPVLFCPHLDGGCGVSGPQRGQDTWLVLRTCVHDPALVGVDFLVPVMGYICHVCRKFCHGSSRARLSHCKSLAHFENMQKHKAAESSGPTSRPVSRQCAINARNALTALFTSSVGGGRSPSQSSPQDKAKTPSKVTPGSQSPNPPPRPRRSSRLKT